MGKIREQHKVKTPQWISLKQEGEQRGDRADCAVKAIAVVCNAPYAEVHEVMAKLGRKKGRGTKWPITEKAAAHFGFKLVHLNARKFIRDNYPERFKQQRRITTHHCDRLPEAWANGNAYLMRSRKHVTGVVNGVVHDWAKGRKVHVTGLYQIVKA